MCTQVLSLMLGQAGLHLHTFPEVAFTLDKWTMQGYPCVLDKTPNRQLDIHVRPTLLISSCFLIFLDASKDIRISFHTAVTPWLAASFKRRAH
jgi:hypothetical protein